MRPDDAELAPLTSVDTPHNAAHDSALTRPLARVMDAAAQPLVDHIYGPITEYNHTLGLVTINASLTGVRLLERSAGNLYIDSLENSKKVKAAAAVGGKLVLKGTDGLDGPVTRATGTTSQFGAFFDAAVDMAGTYDDGRCIKQRARTRGDQATINIVNARLATDVGVIISSALIDFGVTLYAKRLGVEVPPEDETKATSMAKVKFALSAVGNGALLASEIIPNTRVGKIARRAGQALDIASTAAGVVSIYQYGQKSMRKIQRIREHNAAVPNTPQAQD